MDDSIDDEHPIEAQIAADRKERKRQEAACLAEIKAVHAAGTILDIDTSDDKLPRVGGYLLVPITGSILKTSPSGEPIGWYREGQKSGKPNQLMPVAQDLEAAYKDWEKQLRSSESPTERAAHRGKKSGKIRRVNGLAPQILALAKKLGSDVKKHHMAKYIANELSCTVDYVREVLREDRKAKEATIPKKNVV
ncbi:hypothetical protein SAMN04515618_11790 [Collimonas sp. OK307]|uniref:hypothetical protein n=1 Tax=Collimonas sp. OK307 TaxID=1801620 RepID=UPI0008E30B45|nr:hypothetical protein [Collimonas sp. OK307]SFI32754.1 hypothetical protein SAMN04515618_11790 [Collimonas sp. OK307]